MTRSLAVALGAFLAVASVSLSAASAADLCEATEGPTVTEAEVLQILADQGYTDIRKIEEEDGCIEAKGMDDAGNRVEVYIHPNSGEIVKVKKS